MHVRPLLCIGMHFNGYILVDTVICCCFEMYIRKDNTSDSDSGTVAKVFEEFCKIFSAEWKDAFSEFGEECNEETAVRRLMDILKVMCE